MNKLTTNQVKEMRSRRAKKDFVAQPRDWSHFGLPVTYPHFSFLLVHLD
jgi:hypothetical protein